MKAEPKVGWVKPQVPASSNKIAKDEPVEPAAPPVVGSVSKAVSKEEFRQRAMGKAVL